MSEYLKKLNEDFMSKGFNDWYLDDLCNSQKNYNDEIYTIFLKYNDFLYDCASVRVEEEDVNVILSIRKTSDNILIKCFENYLIASCEKTHNKSTLVNNCLELIDLFFENIRNIDGGLPVFNLSIVLKWTIQRFPSDKMVISKKLFDYLYNGNDETIMYFSTLDYILRDEKLVNIFTTEQYVDFYDKCFKLEHSQSEFNFYHDFYRDFLDYFLKNINNNKKRYLKDFCDFIMKNIDLMENHMKQIELQKVRRYMDSLRVYSDKDYMLIDNELEKVNKAVLSELQCHTITLTEEQQKQIQDAIAKSYEGFKSLNNEQRLIKLFFNTKPLSLKNLTKLFENSKKGLISFFGESILDSDGRVINFDVLTRDNEFSLKSTQNIGDFVEIYMNLIFTPFIKTFSQDDKSKIFINGILTNNKLVDPSKADFIESLFSNFLEGDYRNSVFDIVEELEDSLRFYFKKEGLNIIKTNESGQFIDINYVFNNNKNNSFRDKLLETIDEDFYFTLKWFLTDEYGFNLRNKIAHRINSKDLYKTTFAIYAVIQILRLYWGFQN